MAGADHAAQAEAATATIGMTTGAPAGTAADGSAPAALAEGTAGHHLGEIDTQKKYVEMPVTGMGDIRTEAVSSSSSAAAGMVSPGLHRGTNHHLNPRCSADGKGEIGSWGWGLDVTAAGGGSIATSAAAAAVLTFHTIQYAVPDVWKAGRH